MDPTAGQKPFKLRLPLLGETTQDLLRRVYSNETAGMSDDEVEGTFLSGPARYGEWLIHAHDPEFEHAMHTWYREMLGLVAGPGSDPNSLFRLDAERSPDLRRWALMMLWMHCELLPSEYIRVTVIDTMPEIAGVSYEQLFLLDKPDSDIWDDDQRLVLKFIKAFFAFEMTDELFDAAVQAWGPKMILRSAGLLMYYYLMNLLYEATGLDRFKGLTPDKSFYEQTQWPESMRGGPPPQSPAAR